MIVQDINVLRWVSNHSLIKDITARNLKTRNIESVGRLEEAIRPAVALARRR